MVKIPDLGDDEFPTTVRAVSRGISATSRTFTVELRPSAAYAARLRPNLVAQVRIQNYAHQNVPVLPVDAVQKDETNVFVFLADGNKAVKRVIHGQHQSRR